MARPKTKLDKSIIALIEKFGPIIADAFFTSFADIRDTAVLKNVVEAISLGDVEGAFQAMGFSEAAMRPLSRAIETAFETGGIETASTFPRLGTNKAVFRFDVRNSRAEKWLREYSSNLITEISESQKLAVRELVEIGVRDGRNPRNIGLDIVGRVDPATGRRTGGIVGLTSGQARAVARARAELSDPATAGQYLTRARRDGRFDSVVRRSIASGVPLDADTISRLTGKYADSLLKLRGETIGRTEALQSLNQAREQAFRQAVDEGLIQPNAVKRVWDSAGKDGRTRDTHLAMDGQTVGLDEPFISPSGARLMFPGDSSLGAPGEEIINCRCVIRHDVDFLAGVEGPPSVPTAPVVPQIPLRPISEIAPNSFIVNTIDPDADLFDGKLSREAIQQSHARLPDYIADRYAIPALADYVGSGYRDINGYLRVQAKGTNSRGEPFKINPVLDEKVSVLNSLMKPSTMTYKGFRGVKSEFDTVIEGLGVGDTFQMDGFTSVARDNRVSRQFAGSNGTLFKFDVPKGTPMITTNDGETELILRSGHNFRILKVEEGSAAPGSADYRVRRIITLKLVG